MESEMTGYRSDVPENWFVDPINLGVPGVRKIETDDDNALALSLIHI